MKMFMFCSIVLFIFYGGIELSHGEKLKCEFNDMGFYIIGSLYTCNTASLGIENKNSYIDGYIGVHKPYKNGNNVKAIYIHHTNTRYIPANLGSTFQLNALTIHDSQLGVIEKKDFQGMQNLKYLSLKFNNLIFVSSDAFNTLENLRVIDLSNNQLKLLPNDLFSNNLNLELISLENNKIKYLGFELFNGLSKLRKIDLTNNPCASRAYHGHKEIIQLKQYMKNECFNSNEVPAKITTTTVAQNQVSLMIIKGPHLNSDEKLKCEFGNFIYNNVNDLYSCEVTSLHNPNDNIQIDSYTGVHQSNNNINDIRGISIHNTNTIYIPKNLGLLFNQLTAFLVDKSQLVEIKAANFHGMQELTYLSLYDNKLTSVPSDAFLALPKLKTIYLGENQIEQISSGLFSNNLNLGYINFNKNKIKIIDSEFINGLTNLYAVDLSNNICLNENFYGSRDITKLKSEIEIKCKDPEKINKPIYNQQKELEDKIIELEKELAEAKKCEQNEQTTQETKIHLVVNKKSSQVKVGWQEKIVRPRK